MFKINFFLVFLNYFDALILKKKNLKIIKYYFDAFLNEKHFKKQRQSRFQTHPKQVFVFPSPLNLMSFSFLSILCHKDKMLMDVK